MSDERPKLMIPHFVRLWTDPITSCSTLGEIRQAVDRLVEEYGDRAQVEFDSGHSNISESLWANREETDQEYRNRCDNEDAEARRKVREAAEKEVNERALLKELQAKYGTGDTTA